MVWAKRPSRRSVTPPNRVDYLPIIDRPVIRWPNDARVALWISPNVEHYEYLPDNEGVIASQLVV